MTLSFEQWGTELMEVIKDLKNLLEEEFQSLFLPEPHLFHEIQKKKKICLQRYTDIVLSGKLYTSFLKELPNDYKARWRYEMEALQTLADRNTQVTQRLIKEIQQSFASFHEFLKRPALQSPYHFTHTLSLGLDRRM